MKKREKHFEKLTQRLRDDARSLGFDAIGISPATSSKLTKTALKDFVKSGFHGSMAWMEDTVERRCDPQVLWGESKSVIMLAVNYGPETDPLDALTQKENGIISVYARNRDYHDIIKGRLKTLASKLVSQARSRGLECSVKVFVDTAPVMEKPLAVQAGLGWQGKHTNLVSREFGSWLFLGSIFTTLELPPDAAEIDHCGSCANCLDICPTDAFPAPYKLDARRCISYLTIENKGPIPVEFREAMGNRIYGCDDCLAVCPWNKFAQVTRETKLATPGDASSVSLADFLSMDDAAFRKRFSGSPVKRIGHARFVRNCLIAAGNSRCTNLIDPIRKWIDDPDPIINESAQWALDKLTKSKRE